MSDTLLALHRAVIDNPADRTVRLVYADALDEAGEPIHSARAAFIRSQIELESLPESDPRRENLAERAQELFDEHWLDWWRPVAAAAGLPAPQRTGRALKRARDRVVRGITGGPPKRPRDWPYSHTARDTSVHLADYGTSVRFAGGFPEEVKFLNLDTPDEAPPLVHRWGDAMPLARLSFSHHVTPSQWESIDGPHLSRLADLRFDWLRPELAPRLAESPHLAALARLDVNVIGADADAVRALIGSAAPWTRLKSLQFTGRLSPDAARDVAAFCVLAGLEELHLTLGDPGGLGGALGQMLGGLLQMFARALTLPGVAATRWSEYGPPLQALAAAPWVKRLRRLTITGGSPLALLGVLGERLYGSAERGAELLPDEAVHALADALDRDTLERLVLPAAATGPSAREELAARLGARVAFH